MHLRWEAKGIPIRHLSTGRTGESREFVVRGFGRSAYVEAEEQKGRTIEEARLMNELRLAQRCFACGYHQNTGHTHPVRCLQALPESSRRQDHQRLYSTNSRDQEHARGKNLWENGKSVSLER